MEHVDDQETEIVDNDVHDIVQHSPPVLQPQNQSIADRRTKRNCGPRPRLIEECDMVHYAFSCAEQVENIHEPAIYTEAVVSGDHEKWISAMQEEMQSLKKMAHGMLCACLNKRRSFVANGSSRERRVCLLVSLQDLRQG